MFTIQDPSDKLLYKIIDKHLLKEISWGQALIEDMKEIHFDVVNDKG